eukprot:scaffold160400_cov15-Tisochrysis_lutea.AAC.1
MPLFLEGDAGVFGINPAHVEALCDGETDAKGLLWHVHARDRLPMDILSQTLARVVQCRTSALHWAYIQYEKVYMPYDKCNCMESANVMQILSNH